MAKQPKTPKFQGLPTLESLAKRRGQSVADVLSDWGVKTEKAAAERCQREGVQPPADLAAHLPWKEPVTLIPNAKGLNKEMLAPAVERAKKVLADLDQKPESKKPAKGKLTSDGADAGTKDRAGEEPAPVAEAADGAAASKA